MTRPPSLTHPPRRPASLARTTRLPLSLRLRVEPQHVGPPARIHRGGAYPGNEAGRIEGRVEEAEEAGGVEGRWSGCDVEQEGGTRCAGTTRVEHARETLPPSPPRVEHAAAMAEKQREADATNAALLASSPSKTSRAAATPVETTLWTDRYRPKRFVDLLGDERVHRTALLWLKEWDACVSKGTSKATAAAELKRERSKKRAREGTFGAGGAEGGGFQEAVRSRPVRTAARKDSPPLRPPGLGQTTLAHVLARQAGYQVLEINASDDRTSRIVDERIRNAVDSQALTSGWKPGRGGAGGKGKEREREEGAVSPTCVVVDEIDGAGGGGDTSFGKTLVKLVTEGSLLKKPSRKGKGKQQRPLLRPIICICNDLYAPALRPLRPLAKIIRFNPLTAPMLIKRLRTICDVEGLSTENKHLSLLVDVAEGDLRSCLNTLQFIKRNGSTVDEHAIRSSALGQKDTGTSSSQVLDRLFKKPPRKRGAPSGDGVGADERNPTKTAASVAPEAKQAVDFFGRAILPKAGSPAAAAEGDSLAIAPPPLKRVRQATYRFNEGFSNAVRVNKKVSDFF
ncbi:chromosome transmission fidelity protein [Rhodotorula toruloides NP11]|uniref:Chromosome transmission fidelity protein n=1 Tax=Rhodotorula toruloides (strain NP11) TaxID=1130832 RepID=M7WVN8_RHOT1|nr:chromosome transmission fidelity protein [Rhodotorula toruloides NP11]EMS21920.1 chromosome transmission fidelity protein [Rhodotorula toruloides NP11]